MYLRQGVHSVLTWVEFSCLEKPKYQPTWIYIYIYFAHHVSKIFQTDFSYVDRYELWQVDKREGRESVQMQPKTFLIISIKWFPIEGAKLKLIYKFNISHIEFQVVKYYKIIGKWYFWPTQEKYRLLCYHRT